MGSRFRKWEIDQTWLLPPSVRDLVPRGHLAHFVRDLVREELDLGGILSSYESRLGQPPYHPVMMTALLLYAYSRGVYSSRRIATACQERVDFMAVTAMQEPDFRTISDFRKRHLAALSELFVQVLQLCDDAGLAKLGHVALDGSKVKANASKHKSMSYERMCSEEKKLEAVVRGWLEQAESTDEEEDARFGKDSRGDELPDWVANREERRKRIREAKESLERKAREEAKALEGRPARNLPERQRTIKRTGKPPKKEQRNFTDPESRIMRRGSEYLQGYNCQAAVDADSQVIVARAVINQQNDVDQLVPMLNQIRANLGRQCREVSADSGYCADENLKELKRRRIRGYVATGRQRHGARAPDPARRGSRWKQEMTRRLRCGGFRSRYRLRKQTVEPVFGQIKDPMGFTRFLLRGLEKVASEWSLVCTAHNLRKLARACGSAT